MASGGDVTFVVDQAIMILAAARTILAKTATAMTVVANAFASRGMKVNMWLGKAAAIIRFR